MPTSAADGEKPSAMRASRVRSAWGPVSYAPAFEAAVRGTEGFTPASVSRLSDYAGKLGQLWWPDTVLSSVHAGIDDKPVEHLGERLSGYPKLVETAVADSYPGDGS